MTAVEPDRLVMPARSRHAGQPIDVSSRRSIEIRRETIHDDDSEAIVDYFYHLGCYWTALVPLDSVREVRAQGFNFSKVKTRKTADGPVIIRDANGIPKRKLSVLNHVQSRFILSPERPVLLFPLGSSVSEAPAHQIDDVIYSHEAVGPQGVKFNFRDGLTGGLISAHRFLSTTEIVFERIVVENQYLLETPPLPLNAQQRRGVFVEALRRSHGAGTLEPYYLFRCCGTNNCTSNPFRILDSVVSYNWRQRLGATLFRLPLQPRFYLRLRGLDADPTVRNLVRTEFQDFINAPHVQKRKREHIRRVVRSRRERTKASGKTGDATASRCDT